MIAAALLVTRKRLGISTLRQIELRDEWLEPQGPDPQLDLDPGPAGWPHGLVLFSVHSLSLPGEALAPRLYADLGQGFTEGNAWDLAEIAPGWHIRWIHLPEVLRGVRLDPSEGGCRFQIRSVSLTRVGRISRTLVRWSVTILALKSRATCVVGEVFRYRTHFMTPRAGQDVTEGRRFSSQSMDPQVILRSNRPAPPRGWVLLTFTGSGEDAPLSPKIYVDRRGSFDERDSIVVSRRWQGAGRVILALGEPVRAVRLDPQEHKGDFSLSGIRIVELGSLALWIHLMIGIFVAARSSAGFRGVTGLGARLMGGDGAPLLGTAYSCYRQLRAADPGRRSQRDSKAVLESLRRRPLLSILMPVFDPKVEWLTLAIESVRRQTYPDWELCIADDHSSQDRIRRLLRDFAKRDARIKLHFRETRGHISEATNSALDLASGEFVAFLDHDDELEPDALLEIAVALDKDPDLDLIYTDEDKIDADGSRFDPFYKPDWSPEYLLSLSYTSHLSVYRADLVRSLGGLRSSVVGAQDYDLALRATGRTARVGHIPKVLYHWRAIPGSTAAGLDQKDYVSAAVRESLRSHIESRGIQTTLEPGIDRNLFRVRYSIAGDAKVSVIIPTAGAAGKDGSDCECLVARCLETLRRLTTWPHMEIVVVHDGRLPPQARAALARAGVTEVVCSPTGGFNFSHRINAGARAATGDHLLLLNDDTEIIDGSWIEALLEYSQQDRIGAVGAKLLYSGGQIQHAGVLLVGGHFVHPYLGDREERHRGYFNSAIVARNYLAVTGACLMVKAALFREVGGLDPAFPLNYNDVDFCLRLHQRGYRNVYTPYARLLHHESQTRAAGVDTRESDALRARWWRVYGHDPYYNINLSGEFPYRES